MTEKAAARTATATVAAAIAAFAVWFAFMLPTLGRNIPQPAIERDYLIALVWAAVLGASIFLWPVRASDKRALLFLWAAKCFVTLVFMLAYEWNYGLDAYTYFSEGQLLRGTSILHRFGIGSGTSNIVAVSSLIANVVPDSYHALKVSFAMIGLVGIYLIYRAAIRFLGYEDRRILFALGLFPSIIFWSSILGKDPLQFLGIALYVYGVVAWARTSEWRFLIPIGLGVFIAASMRIWSGPILMVPLIAVVLRKGPFGGRRLLVAAAAAIGLFVAWSGFADRFRLENTEDLLLAANGLSTGWEAGGSTLQGAATFTDLPSLVAHVPAGVVTALFRPLPGEVNNAFGLIAGCENLLILILCIRAVMRGNSAKLRDPVIRWALLLVLVWSAVYGFTAYNLGSMARFKLQILPILLLTLLYLGGEKTATRAASRSPEPA